jgi:hypothetical protein
LLRITQSAVSLGSCRRLARSQPHIALEWFSQREAQSKKWALFGGPF